MRTAVIKTLIAMVSLTITLLVVEGSFRLLPQHQDGAAIPSDTVVEPDPDLIWRLKPQHEGPFVTNELGLRDTPFNPNADYKVLLLGDSVSWGDGIRQLEKTYPWILEKTLNISGDRVYEVINSAVPGYSTFQQSRYLETKGFKFLPDLIILQFCLNDVVERYHRLATYGGDNFFIGIDTRHAVGGTFGWLLQHSRAIETIMRLAKRSSRRQEEYQVEKLAAPNLSVELEGAWSQALAELDDIRRLSAEEEIPLLVVVMPYRFQLDRTEQTSQPQARMESWAKSRDVALLDLLPAFAAKQNSHPDTPLFFDPSHLTVEGHRLTAKLIAKQLPSFIQQP